MNAIASRSAIIVTYDDDRHARLLRFLRSHRCHVECEAGREAAILKLQQAAVSGLFYDTALVRVRSDTDGSLTDPDLLAQVRKASPNTCIMAILDDGSIPRSGEAFQRGADACMCTSMPLEEAWCRLISSLAWRRRPDAEKQLPDFLKHGLDVGISIIDRNYRILYANEYQLEISAPGVHVPGLCWAEYDHAFEQAGPCPWCPVRETFVDGWSHTRTTISEKTDGIHFYDVKSLPIWDEKTEQVIAAVELVRDITDSMPRDCRAAALEGRQAFREAMEDVLRRVCDLGFVRARLYAQTRDPRYMEGIAGWGPHDGEVVGLTLDADNYQHFQDIKKASGVIYFDGNDPCPLDPGGWILREDGAAWLEVPLRVPSHDVGTAFVGLMCVDNGRRGEEDLTGNREFWPLLEEYANLLAPIVKEAVAYWMRHERAQQAQTLRELDLAVIRGDTAEQQMKSIVQYAKVLLGPRHCHIRLLKGDDLVLMADTKEPNRVRDVVKVDDDVSVSAELARLGDTETQLIETEEQIKDFVKRLRAKGLTDTADYVDKLRSCGAFKLVDSHNELIGTLVLDAADRYFFDEEKLSLTRDLVNRAQVLLESSLRRESADARARQVEGLLNAIPAEAVVLDRRGRVVSFNEASATRMGVVDQPPGPPATRFADALRCVDPDRPHFHNQVMRVFRRGKTARMIASFAATGATRQMDVTIAPFEKSDENVETVAVILSDISDWAEVESISERVAPHEDLTQSLREPIEHIRRLFGANRAGVAEVIDFSGQDTAVTIWCQVDPTEPFSSEPEPIGPLPHTGSITERLNRSGYITVSNVPDFSEILPAVGGELGKRRIQSLLVVPIDLYGKPWGVLGVAYEDNRDFSGREVTLLQTAAAQISLIVLIWQQVKLRAIDRKIAEGAETSRRQRQSQRAGENGLLESILREAIHLTASDCGHIRGMDWFRDKAVLESALLGSHGERVLPSPQEEVAVGDPVSGVVAESGKPIVVNDRDADPYPLAAIYDKYQSYACVPLIADEEVLGTFALVSGYKGHFTERRLRLLSDFTSRTALTLLAEQHLKRMREMANLVNEILNVDRLEDLWPTIPEVAVKLFLCEDAAVSGYDHVSDLLCRQARYNPKLKQAGVDDVGHAKHPTGAEGCGLTLYVAKTGRELRLAGDEVRSHPHRHAGDSQREVYLPSRKLESVMVRRLETPDGKTVGVLKLENRKGRLHCRGFTEFDEAMMRLVTTKFAIAIDRLRFLEVRNAALIAQTHDLKTPLQNIRLTLGGFADGVFTMPEDMFQLQTTMRSVELLDALIFGALDVAQGRIDPSRIAPTDLRAREIIEKALDVLSPKLDQDEWQRDVYVDPSAECVYAGKEQLLRALLNLCHNAWRHGRAQTGMADQENRLEVTAFCEKDDCVLRVADRGPGFQTAESTGPTQTVGPDGGPPAQGHGIGLAAVRLVAQVHCGTLTVGNREDGKSGTVAEMRWNHAELRKRYD